MADRPQPRQGGFTRGQMAARTGLHIETIRYYERIGLVAPPPRTAGGHRIYDHGHQRRLDFICHGKKLGFALEEIRELLDLADQQNIPCQVVRDMTLSHAQQIRAKIQDLQRIEAVLHDMAASCDRGTIPDCPIVDTLYSAPADAIIMDRS